MSAPLRLLLFALFAITLACQRHGRVHETPPRPHPTPSNASPEQPSDTWGEPTHDLHEPAPTPSEPSEPWGWGEPTAREQERSEAGHAAPPSAPSRGAAKSSRDFRSDDRESAGAERGRARPDLYEPPPRRRPGLATHWGETRYSPAREVDFERASPERPLAAYEIHYNDREGARRMLPGGHWGTSQLSALSGSVRLSMVNSRGEPFSALRHGSRVVVIGQPGERYALLIQNHSAERFEIVASVDGLDVLDGEDGNLDKRGYLVGPYSSVLIDGFRRSSDEVAAFRLGDVARSYAASKGKARNVGVIGFAVFDERETHPYPYRPIGPRWRDDTELRRSADPFPGSYAKPPAW